MPRKQTTFLHSSKFEQQSLLDLFGSSPPSSPNSKSFRNSPSPGPSKRKRTSSSSHSDKVVNDIDSASDVDAIRFEPEAVEISDEDQPPRPKKRKGLAGAHIVPKSAASDESMDETLIVPRNRKEKKKVVLDSEDEALPRKRKLIKGIRPPTPDEDDDDILEAENQVLESRLRSRGKMTMFQKNLEKFKMLKGKKRGEIVLGSSSSEADQSENPAAPFKGAKPHHSGESDAPDDETDSNEEDDQGFIVDDAYGVPPAQLPLAFSLSTHQDLTHHFKIVCQLFVHVAVRPLVQRRPFLERALKEEEYLAVPLQVTRRKLSGIRDLLVASSVWRSNFKKALETYPKFSMTRLEFTVPRCDACHLGGRVSTIKGRLKGEPYDEYDFEDVSDDELNESSKEDEARDSDSDGDRDARQVFHLGRFCAARTRVYHEFSHWEHSLYKSLQREILRAQDETERIVKVAYFDGIKPPRDLHDADRVMEWLDERGIINVEWQKVRQMMDRARKLERGEMVDDGI